MRIFKFKDFARYARKADITDAMLRKAVADALKKPDANLGGEVFKQRVARSGGGKSGGYRTIILLRKGARAFFVHGFAKNERDNIDARELQTYKKLAALYLNQPAAIISALIADGELMEVPHDET